MAEIYVKRKPLQKLLEDGIQFPDEYIWEDANYGVIDASAPLAEIPIIDITFLNDTEELDKLRSALTSWGCFQIMSNGIFKSPVHRVLTNSKKEMSTRAMFCASEAGKEIEPVGELNDRRPRMYKAVKDYHQTYDYFYQQGKRAIDSVKI